jgi:alpha/beta superfamily hydrolase
MLFTIGEPEAAHLKAERKRLPVLLCFIAGWVTFLIAGCAAGNYTQNDVKISIREKVTVKLEVYEPKDKEPRGVAIMFPGGGGQIAGSNFVVRKTPQFVEQGYAVAIMDVPSDMWNLPVEFRWTAKHQEDIKKVVGYIKDRYPQKPVFMIAFSNGNYSTMNFPVFYPEGSISGTIFLSAGWGCIEQWRFAKMPYPVLLVQHENDTCNCFNFRFAKEYYEKLDAVGRKDLLAVQGGSLTMRQGNQCGPYHYHAFEGLEDKVTKAVIDWMDGRQIPQVIN